MSKSSELSIRGLKAIILLSISIILLLCFVSYHRYDPSLNTAGKIGVDNILFYPGAYLADFFFQTLGVVSYLIVFFFFIRFIQTIFAYFIYLSTLRWFLFVISLFIISNGLYYPIRSFGLDIMSGSVATVLYNIFHVYELIISIVSIVLGFALYIFSLAIPASWIKKFFSTVFSLLLKRRKKTTTIKKRPVKKQKIKTKEQKKYSSEKNKEAQYFLPIPLINNCQQTTDPEDNSVLVARGQKLVKILLDFGITGEIINITQGPIITLYELRPAPGTKASKILALSEDIARNMSTVSARISSIPGRDVIGIELPNTKRFNVCFKELLESTAFIETTEKLPLILGQNIAGKATIVDLASMPHLLVAGTTGSGKSVAMNAMILSLLYKFSPEQCRLILIDPKMLEFSAYEGITHLLLPVVTEAKKAVFSLKWLVSQMEQRYKLMSILGVRNMSSFNERIATAKRREEKLSYKKQHGFDENGDPIYTEENIELKYMYYIVVFVDEMADLMIVAGKELEGYIQRLAQMARAAGIHLIMATQRPSVDVITGTIKANFPTRISFQLSSKIDSRVILGEQGAEQLLGKGDMLYSSGSSVVRLHGALISDEEVLNVCSYLRTHYETEYAIADFNEYEKDQNKLSATIFDTDLKDVDEELYQEAYKIVMETKKVSISYIQRKLKIGYNRAANIVEKMEQRGVVSEASYTGRRRLLLKDD